MFADTRNLENGTSIEADVCVIGAGAAGITLALALNGCPLKVAVLESGGLEADRSTQTLNEGTTDDPYAAPLDESRSRGLGGTTTRWAGWCRELDETDFEARSWVPHSGWPFGRTTLEPFYAEAARICELTTDAAPATHWPLDADLVTTREFRLSPPTSFGRKYRGTLSSSKNVTVFLHGSASYIHRDDAGTSVEMIQVRPTPATEIRVKARVYVVATGGIENARILLASAPDPRNAIGNEHDLVGRFYMDHPAFFSGTFTPSTTAPPATFYTTEHVSNPGRDTPVTGAFSLSDRIVRDENLLGAVVRFVPRPAITLKPEWEASAVVSARRLLHFFRQGRIPPHPGLHISNAVRGLPEARRLIRASIAGRGRERKLALRTWIECAPRRDNRVTLSERSNWLGPLPHVRWQADEDEKRAALRLHQHLARAVEDKSYGRLDTVLDHPSDPWPVSQTGASHHMGTTRMHDSPRHGVVDRNSRVHGGSNLYMAGSSVFPTGGYANPTLTIVALSLRLASHLKDALGTH